MNKTNLAVVDPSEDEALTEDREKMVDRAITEYFDRDADSDYRHQVFIDNFRP